MIFNWGVEKNKENGELEVQNLNGADKIIIKKFENGKLQVEFDQEESIESINFTLERLFSGNKLFNKNLKNALGVKRLPKIKVVEFYINDMLVSHPV